MSVVGSFNDWSAPLPLSRPLGGDWVRSVAIAAPGPIQYKFIVDGVYASSPCEECVTDGNGHINNYRTVQPNYVITWPATLLGGEEVFVAGDWSEWQELLPMVKDPDTGEFTLCVCLPPGQYAFTFLVDGVWRRHPELDAAHTADGRITNLLTVESPPAFRIYYATGWKAAHLKVRGLDATGTPLDSNWTEVPLHDTAGRGHPGALTRSWKTALVFVNGPQPPSSLEFIPVSKDGEEDRPPGTSRDLQGGQPPVGYVAPCTGSFKLHHGKLRPFPRGNKPPLMLVSDLDGTLVGEGPEADAATAEFAAYWEEVAALTGARLVYNTGRSLGQFLGLLQAKSGALPVPDALITAVGTKIFLLDREGGTRGTASGLGWIEDATWAEYLAEPWDLDAIREASNVVIMSCPPNSVHWLDDGREHPHRIALSVKVDVLDKAVSLMKSNAASRGIEPKIIVSGTGEWRYLDVVSPRGGKLAALEYVCALFRIPLERCVAAGDSGNDALMLSGSNPSIVVGNAQPELMEWVCRQSQDGRLVVADACMARGVLEGLARLGLY